MQTKPEAEVGALNGATHVPLLRREQLIPGAIFCGIASDHVHEVVSVDGDAIVIQRLPRKALPGGHKHRYTEFDNTTCACGLSNRAVPGFLPDDASRETPRAHVLVPHGPVMVPEPYSLYLGERPDGSLVTFSTHQNGTATSDGEFPIVTRAAKIWGLPPQAVALAQEATTQRTANEL